MKLLPLLFLALLAVPIQAQTTIDLSRGPDGNYLNAPANVETQQARGDRFHLALSKAIRASVRKGELSRAKAVRIRVAMLSPAFRKHVENLAVIQMAFSADADVLPFNADGKIERANIDWDSFLAFLEKLIPLILQLMDLFGA